MEQGPTQASMFAADAHDRPASLVRADSHLDEAPAEAQAGKVYLGDNLPILRSLPAEHFQMIYIDPPFNTGRVQTRVSMKTVRSLEGTRTGFKGARYSTEVQATHHYLDTHDDYLGFLEPRLIEANRVLHRTGTMYLHLDYREVHYAKVLMDEIFGRENFLNEIIWAYDYGARATKRWPAKHDNILVYARDITQYWFDAAEVDREPYMAPGLVTPAKAALGKLPTDVWWHTIVSPTGREKTGYPNQKPVGILRRMVTASTRRGDRVLDFFAGSGTAGYVAKMLGRTFVLIDSNPVAVEIIRERLGNDEVLYETIAPQPVHQVTS